MFSELSVIGASLGAAGFVEVLLAVACLAAVVDGSFPVAVVVAVCAGLLVSTVVANEATEKAVGVVDAEFKLSWLEEPEKALPFWLTFFAGASVR